MKDTEKDLVNFLRVNSVNMIKEANSGHPGICLGASPILYTIYKNAMVTPVEPLFINRDRFVLSAGHGSAMLYSMLYLYNFGLKVEDLKAFRKVGSITPGHPEYGVTAGVDASTGPLGQGIANAVGLAIAERHLASIFNKPNFDIFDHYTYCLCGDGCLMEGVAVEALSIAGNLKLNKLILFYDDNNITIQGKRTLSNTENTKLKFESMNWNVLQVFDANDLDSLQSALDKAKQSDKPSVIMVNSHIGFGSDLQDSEKCHGTPLTQTQIDMLKQTLNYKEQDYVVPKSVQKLVNLQLKQKHKLYNAYNKMINKYKKVYAPLYAKLKAYLVNTDIDLISEFQMRLKEFNTPKSSREMGGIVLNSLSKLVPNLIGGCADVAPSTKAFIKDGGTLDSNNYGCKNINFGVREHAMGAICNGIALHGGLKAFCSTFFAFENYMTPSIRMACLMNLPVMYIFTHDSLAAGEDGPTHQPIEQIATLRAMPNIKVFRPCNILEVAFSYNYAINSNKPSAILLTRQNMCCPVEKNANMYKGAYIISKSKKPKVTLVASGSEVEIVLQAKTLLEQENISVNVVSMLCEEIFAELPKDEQRKIISPKTLVVTMEASGDNVWYKYATNKDCVINLKTFGLSGSFKDLYSHFDLTMSRVVNVVKQNLNKK